MTSDALERFPNECCGFFFGEDGDNRTVTHVMKVNNSKEGDQRRRFAISPVDYMKAEAFADEQRVQLLGIYHSHPLHPAWPSVHDREQAMPWFSYIIIGVQPDQITRVNSFQLNDDRLFTLETIE